MFLSIVTYEIFKKNFKIDNFLIVGIYLKYSMLCSVVEKAYAKVNFGLKVLPKREDGFHNIESIFQTINLYDELNIAVCNKGGCHVQCDSMNLPENNTLVLAFNAFIEITKVKSFGVNVELKKRIPSGGGLGGGSADAAALVRGLEKLSNISLTREQKDYIASKTGSDVFFFIHCKDGKGCALVSGRGEDLSFIKPRYDLFLLLMFPEVHSSTAEAYALVDEFYASGNGIGGPSFKEFEKTYRLPVKEWSFENSFTPCIAKKYKIVFNAMQYLENLGCTYVQMSGSGSTVYGVFELEQQAMCVQNNLPAEACNCKLVQTV